MYCGNKPTEWSKKLGMAEFVHNSHSHATTKETLFFLLMNYNPQRLPEAFDRTDT